MSNRILRAVGLAVCALGMGGCDVGSEAPSGAASTERQAASPSQGAVYKVVDTASGAARGFHDGTVLTFYGIPYAAPPLGDLRWRAPQPPAPWEGVRDATTPASPCVQSWDGSGSEDCLYLNVFVPAGTHPDAALPTMVHLHGGGNSGGSAHEDATLLVERGVVVVTLNYRMNVFGFLAHPALTAEAGHSSNYGLLDQIAALQWVRSNIGAFGGDPDNVTLFGMSAGSFDTTALAASPLTEGLIDRAAIQGSVPWADSLAWAERQGKGVAWRVGCNDATDVAGCLRKASVEVLLEGMGDWFGDIVPVRDGYVLPDYPRVLFEEKKLDLLIGNDREEASWGIHDFLPLDFTEDEYVDLMGSDEWGYGPFTEQMLELYPVSDYDTPFWAVVVVDTDWAYTCSTRRVALEVADGEPDVWRYLFTHVYDHPTTDGFPLQDFGAFHAIEEAFLWDEWDDGGRWYKPTEAEKRLAGQMADYWTNFARTGNPNGPHLPEWPRYDAESERILLLDTPPTASDAYHAPHCDVQEDAHELFIFSQPDPPEPPPIDPEAPYGFDEGCAFGSCLHNCRPYPKDVVDSGSIAPLADFYCLANEPSDDICSTCDRSITLRVERRPADGPIDLLGEPGTPLVVAYDAAHTWPTNGPALPKESGYCYRTAARVELSNGYAAAWAYGPFTCF